MQHSKKSPAKAGKKIKPAITCKTAKGSVEVFRSGKEYYVREVARNGRVLQVSETFHGKRSVLTNLLALQSVLNAALKDKRFVDALGGIKNKP